MRQAAVASQRTVISQYFVAFRLRERPAEGTPRKSDQSLQVARLRFHPHSLHSPERVVHPLEMVADRLHCHGIVARFGLGDIGVAQPEDDRRGADFLIRRPRTARLPALPGYFAALIEKILNPRPCRVIGDEVEFIPEPVQRLLSLVVEDQFYQRGIVAPVSHHVMVAGAQKAPLVLGIVREKTSAFANIECVRENRAEAREGGLVASPFAVRNHEIGIAGPGFQHQSRRANRRFLSEPGIFRDFGRHRRRIARHPQSGAVKIPAVRVELAVLPVDQGLRVGAQSLHHRGGEFHRRVLPDPDHEIAHLDTFRTHQIRLVCARRRQSAPHRLKFGYRANLLFCCFRRFLEELRDHG